MALNESKLLLEIAFVRTRLSQNDVISLEPSDQNVQHFPDCYPVVAGHAQATRAIVPRIQEDPIPSPLFHESPHLGILYRSFACLSLVAAEHEDPLSDSRSGV